MKRYLVVVGLAATAALLWLPPAASIAQQQPAARAGQASGPLLKPGFMFDPSNVLAYPSLQGYQVDRDVLDPELVATAGLSRRLFLIKTQDQTRLRLRIGVSPIGIAEVAEFFTRFGALSQIPPAERLVAGASVGLSIGDESQVGAGSTSTNVKAEIAFRRQNVFVSIEHASEGTLNLLSIATQIDAAIQALPDVTAAQLAAQRPVITQFSAASTQLHPAEGTNLTVAANNPGGGPLTKTYRSAGGYVITGAPDRYQAGSAVGTQTLTLIMSSPALLFDQETISFNVTPP